MGVLQLQVLATDPGSDVIQAVTVNWGDGTTDVFSSPGTYTHQYPVAANGGYQISVSVTDEDCAFPLPGGVFVDPQLDTPEEEVVANLYQDILGRDVDASGLGSFSAQLAAGVPTQQIITALLDSPEYQQKVISDLYLDILGRPVDASGLASNLAIYATGGKDAVLVNLLSSPEFFNNAGGTNEGFMAALYLAVLDRTIDTTGQQNFLDQLAFGVSRAVVIQQLLDSAEGTQLAINEAYEDFLGREGDAGGVQSWIPLYTTDPDAFLVQFLSTPEYTDGV